MSDKHCIYPFVNKSDIIWTKFHISPNSITLFNNLVITPVLLTYLYHDYYLLTLFLVWIREYFDGLDGYIARKYKKTSKEGEIYDHFSDSLFAGTLTNILMSKVAILEPWAFPTGYIMSMFAIVCNYDDRFYMISNIAGAGGNEDGFSFLIPYSFIVFTWILGISNLVELS